MLNSAAAGRRLSRRIVQAQVLAVGAVAAGFLVLGGEAALAAVLGGAAVTLGGALMGWRAFSAEGAGPGQALARLLGAIALKWLVVVVVLYFALAALALDPLAVLGGVLAALAVNLLALKFT